MDARPRDICATRRLLLAAALGFRRKYGGPRHSRYTVAWRKRSEPIAERPAAAAAAVGNDAGPASALEARVMCAAVSSSLERDSVGGAGSERK